MRAITSVWVGKRMGDQNLTCAGETEAQDIIELFEMSNTLSEFNSPTYTGVSLYALSMWVKYLPAGHHMHEAGRLMVQETWKTIGELWHPDLKNVAGPWDRAYGYDTTRYVALLPLWIWDLVGREQSGLHRYVSIAQRLGDFADCPQPEIMSHANDYAYAPVFAVLAEFHRSLVPEGIAAKLSSSLNDHKYETSAYSPPYDASPRNVTAWLGPGISIGAESFDQNTIGGAAESQTQFNPAVIQWNAGDGRIGFISVRTRPLTTASLICPSYIRQKKLWTLRLRRIG
jgi:hypothetical protein